MTEQNKPSSDKPEVAAELLAAVKQALKEATSKEEKKELSQLLAQLKDGSVNVAKATTILSLRGIEWTWSKTKPLLSGALNFVSSAWNEAKKRNTKTDDE